MIAELERAQVRIVGVDQQQILLFLLLLLLFLLWLLSLLLLLLLSDVPPSSPCPPTPALAVLQAGFEALETRQYARV